MKEKAVYDHYSAVKIIIKFGGAGKVSFWMWEGPFVLWLHSSSTASSRQLVDGGAVSSTNSAR